LRPPDQLDHNERQALQEILDGDERLASGYDLLQRFRRLIARRSVRDVDQWLQDAEASELRPFTSLSHGIQSDHAAVVNGLTLPWSTGPVEHRDTRQAAQAPRLRTRLHSTATTSHRQRRLIAHGDGYDVLASNSPSPELRKSPLNAIELTRYAKRETTCR
jgi:Transposase